MNYFLPKWKMSAQVFIKGVITMENNRFELNKNLAQMHCQLRLINFVNVAHYIPNFKAFFTIIKYYFNLAKAARYARAQAVLHPFCAVAHTFKKV